MQSAGAEDLGGELELPSPVLDDGMAEKAPGPGIHLVGHLLAYLMEQRVARDGEFEVALVVQRHGIDLTHGILAVEHPPVGPGQQGVGDVANAAFHLGARLRSGPGALDPLSPQIGRDLGTIELPIPGGPHGQLGARNGRARIEESDRLAFTCSTSAAL